MKVDLLSLQISPKVNPRPGKEVWMEKGSDSEAGRNDWKPISEGVIAE